MITFDDVKSARERIKHAINKTPVITTRTLDKMFDAKFYFKCENYQRAGAFKFRGAYNAISQLTPEQKSRGVIAHSSGNHAQAVALAAKILGVKATIVMPQNSSPVKMDATRKTYDADVVTCENSLKAREQGCEALIQKHGFTLIHPYDDYRVIAGAGTAALELLEEVENDLNAIIAPVGGGGLISGTAIATKGVND
ncbi:MAG: threonine/serine dehydratase, partial [Promethearchaeota archaeon]